MQKPAFDGQIEYVGFILMGGTIQSSEDRSGKEIPDPKIDFAKFIDEVVALQNHRLVTIPICCLDSRDVTDEHRHTAFDEIRRSPANKFVLLHGTYTAEQTLTYLGERLDQLAGKTVIMVASYYTAVDRASMSTDALFNLGGAFFAAQMAAPGIYLAMHGSLFGWNTVTKDLDKQLFVRK